MTIKDQVNELFEQQLSVWEMARNNFEGLKTVQIREFDFDGFGVKVQFNPARMVSSGAKVDAKTIAQRKCFLCAANRPEVQRGIEWRDYDILINPFPIFPRHLTIPRREHVDQQLVPYISDMFDLARELPDFVVFYNGPKCGASAPDHMHFQAGNADFLPLVGDYFNLKAQGKCTMQCTIDGADIYTIDDYLRVVYCIESCDRDALRQAFMKLYNSWVKEDGVEPMMNVVCLYKESTVNGQQSKVEPLRPADTLTLSSSSLQGIMQASLPSALASSVSSPKTGEEYLGQQILTSCPADTPLKLGEECLAQQSAEGKWYLFVIPRGAFRPWQYTAEGDKQLLVSPATVEVSGLFITPVKEHFERITKEDVVDILTQCTIK